MQFDGTTSRETPQLTPSHHEHHGQYAKYGPQNSSGASSPKSVTTASTHCGYWSAPLAYAAENWPACASNGVDLNNGRITNSTTRVVVGGRAEDSDTKTHSSRRSVALDPMTLDALRSYVRLWDIEHAEFQHQGTLLFCWPDGRPIHPETISDWFAQHSIAAALPPIRLHDVRHSYATAALRAGVPVKVVSERLGHSSVAFTPAGLHARHPQHGCRGCPARSDGHPRDTVRTQLTQRRGRD
jgi:hypothetical protein